MTRRSQRNWTIVQILYRDPCPVSPTHPGGWSSRCEKYVVDTPLKSEAKIIVGKWLNQSPILLKKNLHEIHYYPRTYVDQERALRAQGRIIK